MSLQRSPEVVVVSPEALSASPPQSPESPDFGNVTWHTVLSHPDTPTSDMSAGIGHCAPGNGHLCQHRHEQAEIYHILEGDGMMKIDGASYEVTKGSTIFIPGNSEHGIVNVGSAELRWFYVFPTNDFRNVIYQFTK
ncbi:hypothetical protein N7528_005964 [Penicillium herquei]|nr:hypothetical protein N7528_005964 [Penicillium herquei]